MILLYTDNGDVQYVCSVVIDTVTGIFAGVLIDIMVDDMYLRILAISELLTLSFLCLITNISMLNTMIKII